MGSIPRRNTPALWFSCAGTCVALLIMSGSDCAGTGNGNHTANDNQNLNSNGNVNTNLNGSTTASDLIEVPDPLSGDNPVYALESSAAPAAGESVEDTRLGTTQIRATQATGLRHEYSRFDPFNVDGSMILLHEIVEGDWLVYRTAGMPYDDATNVVATVNFEEPRWDPTDPNLMWGLDELRVVTLDVESASERTIKTFTADPVVGPILDANPELYRLTTFQEGETSFDKRYWALVLQGDERVDYRARYIVTWDREEDEVLGTYELSEAESRIDWVGMSWSGEWVLIGGDFDNGGDIGPGLVMTDRGFTEFNSLFEATVHSDIAVDNLGRDVVVMQNTAGDTIDLFPLEVGASNVPLITLFYASDSPIGFNSGVHISCNAPGTCVVSTYIEPGLPEQNWLDRTIVLVDLDRDNPRVFYLAKVYGTTGAYWEETHATISTDGSRVVWATNWDQNVGNEEVWLVQLDLAEELVASTGGPP